MKTQGLLLLGLFLAVLVLSFTLSSPAKAGNREHSSTLAKKIFSITN